MLRSPFRADALPQKRYAVFVASTEARRLVVVANNTNQAALRGKKEWRKQVAPRVTEVIELPEAA